jgi:hypothetical protein
VRVRSLPRERLRLLLLRLPCLPRERWSVCALLLRLRLPLLLRRRLSLRLRRPCLPPWRWRLALRLRLWLSLGR